MPCNVEYLDPNVPSPSNRHWFPWIKSQLNIRSILTQTPELPESFAPEYENWKKFFKQFNLDEKTILIGRVVNDSLKFTIEQVCSL
jgi:hypothetical protein